MRFQTTLFGYSLSCKFRTITLAYTPQTIVLDFSNTFSDHPVPAGFAVSTAADL